MVVLNKFDFKDYSEQWEKELRLASRAIIYLDDKIVLIRSDKFGEYKFPGGGVETNETIYDALIRETYEETGLEIDISSINEFGAIYEKRKKNGFDIVLCQLSFYYKCCVTSKISVPLLDVYEKEWGYKTVIEYPYVALKKNNELLSNYNVPWVKREAFILSML